MRFSRIRLLVIPIAAVAIGAALATEPPKGESKESAKPVGVGEEAPIFILDVLDPAVAGTTRLNLRDFLSGGPREAKAVLVSFYALWCPPCQHEIPFLRELQGLYEPRGLRTLLVSIDKEEERQKLKTQLAAAGGVRFPVMLDSFNLVYRRFRLSALPAIYLVGPDGKVKYFSAGFDPATKSSLKAAIAAAL